MNVVIKLFSTPKGRYLYDRTTNSILALNEDEYCMFQRIQENNGTTEELGKLKSFQKQGLCEENTLEKIEHPQNQFLETHLKSRVQKITLQVTQNCNLRCSYCGYSGKYHQRSHNERVMSYEMMKKCISFLMQCSFQSSQVDIGFYGGEPLLEFENIKRIVKHVKQQYSYKKVTYSITTNGTIFSKEIIEFLAENEFNVLVSLDGPKEIHDKNRIFKNGMGSYDVLMKNLQKVKKSNPEFFERISFSTVIAPGADYKCVSDFFSADEIMMDNNLFATTVSTFQSKDEIRYDDRYYILYTIQRVKMLLALLGFINGDNVSKLLSDDVEEIIRMYKDLGQGGTLPSVAHPGGPCIPGVKRALIDVDGNIYPCERVSESSKEMRIGHIDSGFNLDKASNLLNIGKMSEKECIACWNFVNCGLCAAAVDGANGFSKEEKMKNCKHAMERTLAMFETICLLKENHFDFKGGNYYE